jgi:Pectinacetylesterase
MLSATPTMRPRFAALALAAGALAACGSEAAPPPPAASPWLDVVGMTCADGSPTGIGISRGRSDAVLVYLSGGGACWSATSCDADRAFGKAQFDLLQLFVSGTVFDRTLAGNPFATWTHVFVPYCTGDVHAGDAVGNYGGVPWIHHGFRNLQAAVGALTAALPRPAEVVVSGSSAGGFGALAAYGMVRDAWDPSGGTTAMLLDDSGPTFVGTALPPALLATWWDTWGLASTIGVRCSGCGTDLSEIWPRLAAVYPGDRLALLSTTRDATMCGFFADPALGIAPMDPAAFDAALAGLAAKLSGLGLAVASYRVDGVDGRTRHALLVDRFFLPLPDGAPILDWTGAMVSGAAWTSQGP